MSPARPRGSNAYPQATRRLDELGALTLSAISWLEVLQGMRNKAELLAVKKMLDKRSARLLPVTEAITLRATELMESLTLSHGLQIGDALIAATALDHGLLSPPTSSTSLPSAAWQLRLSCLEPPGLSDHSSMTLTTWPLATFRPSHSSTSFPTASFGSASSR